MATKLDKILKLTNQQIKDFYFCHAKKFSGGALELFQIVRDMAANNIELTEAAKAVLERDWDPAVSYREQNACSGYTALVDCKIRFQRLKKAVEAK